MDGFLIITRTAAESQKLLQRCCGEILADCWILRKFSLKSRCFVAKFPSNVALFPWKKNIYIFCFVDTFTQKLLPPCWKFPQKVAFMASFHPKKVAFMENFHKTLLGWKMSTTTGFVGKFPQKVALLEHFHKTLISFTNYLFYWKIFT